MTLFSFKEKKPRGRGRGKRNAGGAGKVIEKLGPLQLEKQLSLPDTRLNKRLGMYGPYVQEQAQERQQGSSCRDGNFLCATIPCSLLTD